MEPVASVARHRTSVARSPMVPARMVGPRTLIYHVRILWGAPDFLWPPQLGTPHLGPRT